jgi:organic radical activating enzyme
MPNNDTFCVLPFMHLSVFQDGKVKPCCMSNSFFEENYNHYVNFDIFFKNESYQKLRDDLKNGVKNKMCDVCWKVEEYGGRSFRQEKNAHFKKQYDEFMQNENAKSELVFLDARFSNQCNFKCRMCGERDSTSWYEEREEYWEREVVDPVREKLKKWELEDKVYNYVNPFDAKKLHILKNDFTKDELSKLEYVYIAGGEPLYTKKVWDFIETIPSPENVTLQFQTNFSLLEYKGVSIFEFTKKFKNVVYSISLDGLFETGEFQRTNFKTDVFLDNLRKLNIEVSENPKVSYDFTFTASLLNVFHFFETFDYLIDNGYIKDYSQLRLQTVKWPAHLDVKNFNLIKEVKQYFSRTDIKGIDKNPFLKGDIENLILYIEKDGWIDNKEHLENLKNYLIFSKIYNNLKLPTDLEKYIK